MPVERADNKTLTDKKGRLRHLVLRVGGLVVIILAILIIAAVWLIPGVIRKEVEQGLSRFCEGPVEIDIFKVSYSGRLHLEGVKFFDKARRQWLYAEKVDATFANWPSFNPVITEVEIDGLDLRFLVADEKFTYLLAHPNQQSSGSNNRFDLDKLTIKEAAITITDAQGSENVYDNIMFSAIRKNNIYEFLLSRLISESSETLLAEGTFNHHSLDFDISLEVKHQFSKAEMNLTFTALNMREVSAEGNLAANLTVTGSLREPARLQQKGTIQLRNWAIETDSAEAKNILNTDLEFQSSGLRLGNLSISDSNGVEWLSTNEVALGLKNWPGLQPVLTDIDISELKLETSLVNGRLKIPATWPVSGTEQAKNKHLDLQKLTIQDAFIGIAAPNNPRITFDKLGLQFTRRQDLYDIRFTRTTSADANELTAKATFYPKTSDIEISLQSEMTVGTAEMTAVLSALNIPHFSTQGILAADLTVVGCLKQPETLQPEGLIKLRDWVTYSKDGTVSNSLSTDVRLNGSKLWLENLAVRDANDLEWFSAKTSEITFENWPGLRPVLKEIETEGLILKAYLIDGKLGLPVKFSLSKSVVEQSKFLDLQKLVVWNASIGWADRPASKIGCDYLSVQPTEQMGFYDILLMCSKHQGSSSMYIKGWVNPTNSEVDLFLEMDYSAKKQETAVVFAALGMPQTSAEGHLVADLTITGYLNDPLGIQSSGVADFNECILFINDKVLAKNLKTVAKFDGQSLQVDKLSGLVCNGPVDGMIFIEAKQNETPQLCGRFLAQRMSFVELTSIFGGPGREAKKGSVILNYNFTSQGRDLHSLSGDGQILLDDADISVIPVIPLIFNAMGLAQLDPLKMSDAECTFSTSGPTIKITSAHIANPFGAIEAEPGGTINLQTGRIKMYVMAVPLRQIETLARRIPFADIVFNLKDRLTRFYIRGHWSSPPAELITKTPVKDITDGTIGFLQDVVRNGGQFGQDMLKGFRALFPIQQSKSK